jgi:hypothetical protein
VASLAPICSRSPEFVEIYNSSSRAHLRGAGSHEKGNFASKSVDNTESRSRKVGTPASCEGGLGSNVGPEPAFHD